MTLTQAVTLLIGGTQYRLTEHNRSPIKFSYDALSNEERAIDGTLRAYAVGLKTGIELSWTMLPSTVPVGDAIGTVDYSTGQGFVVANATTMQALYRQYYNQYFTVSINRGVSSNQVSGSSLVDTYYMKFDSFNYEVVKRLGNVSYCNVSMSLKEI